MLKITLLLIALLFGWYSINKMDLDDLSFKKEQFSRAIPDDAILDYSFELENTSFKKFLNEQQDLELKPHQKFAFAPKTHRMKVTGYMNDVGSAFMDIEILENSSNPWLENPGMKNDQKAIVRNILVDDETIQSFDASGKLLLNMKKEKLAPELFLEAIQPIKDPKSKFNEFLKEKANEGARIIELDEAIKLSYEDKDKAFTYIYDTNTGLPKISTVEDIKYITTIKYKYECINGRYVLVLQYVNQLEKENERGMPLMEYVSKVTLKNVLINQ